MSDEHSLEITIRTKADLAGAKDALAAMEKQIVAAKAHGKATAGLESQAAKAKSAIEEYTAAHKESGNETEKGGDKAKIFAGHMGEMRKTIRELSHEFPIAGMALRAFVNPIGAALGGAILIFAKVKEKITEMDKESDEAAERMAKGFGNMAKAMQDARRDIDFSSNAITTALKKIADSEKEVKDRTDEATEAIRRQEREMLAITNASEASELAEVDAQRKLNQADPKRGMDEVAALKAEAEIKLRYEHQTIDIQNAADKAALLPQENKLDNQTLSQRRLSGILSPLEADKLNRTARLKNLPDEITKHQTDQTVNDEAVKKQTAVSEDFQKGADRMASWHKSFGMGTDSDVAQSQANATAEATKLKALETAQAQGKLALKQAEDEKAKLELEETNYKQAKTDLEAVSKSVIDLTREVNTLRTVAAEEAKNREDVFNIHRGTEGKKLAAGIIGANKDSIPDGGLPPGVIMDQHGQVTADPRLLLGYHAPVAPRPVPHLPAQPAHEMSAQEVEARGGNKADFTNAQRAHAAAEKNTREVAAHAAAIAVGIEKLTETLVMTLGKTNRDLANLTSRVQNLPNR